MLINVQELYLPISFQKNKKPLLTSMKKILLFAAMLLVAAPQMHAKGDEAEVKIVLVKEENSDNYYYEGIVPVEGVSKEEMFKRAKDWVLSNFKTGDNNIQFDEQSLSIYNSPIVKMKRITNHLNFKIAIYFKDGKYKFRFDNIIFIMFSQTGVRYTFPYGHKYPSKGDNKECNKIIYDIAIGLEDAIKSTGNKKDDW